MYYQAMPYPAYTVHPQQQLDDFYPRYGPNDYADFMGPGMMHDEFGPEMEEISTRPRLTKEQVEVLESQFQANHKPNSQVKRQLAIQTNLKFQRVGVSDHQTLRSVLLLINRRTGSKTDEQRQNSKRDKRSMKRRRPLKSQTRGAPKPSEHPDHKWPHLPAPLPAPYLYRRGKSLVQAIKARRPPPKPATSQKKPVGCLCNGHSGKPKLLRLNKWPSRTPPWLRLSLLRLQRCNFHCASAHTGQVRNPPTCRPGLLEQLPILHRSLFKIIPSISALMTKRSIPT